MTLENVVDEEIVNENNIFNSKYENLEKISLVESKVSIFLSCNKLKFMNILLKIKCFLVEGN